MRCCRGSSYYLSPSPNPLPGFSRPTPSPPHSHTSRCCRRLGALCRAHVPPTSASASAPQTLVLPRPVARETVYPRARGGKGKAAGGGGEDGRFPIGRKAAAERPAGAVGVMEGRALPPWAEIGVSGRSFLTSSLFSTSLNSRLIRCTAMLAMSLPAADSYPPPPPPLRPPPPPPPLPPPPPPSVIQTRAHERSCHCHPCCRVPPQCRITSAPGHQNGARSAHAHHADPGGRRSRSCGSPIRLSCDPAPRRAARLNRGFVRVAPPCGRLGPGGCGFRAGQRGSGPGRSAPAVRPFYGKAFCPEPRTRGGSPTWRASPALAGL